MRPVEIRNRKILNLYSRRYTLEYIGNKFNITKQRVHQIIKTGGKVAELKPLKIYHCRTCPTPVKTRYSKYCKKHKREKSDLLIYLQSIGREGREFTREKVRIRDNWTCKDCREYRPTKNIFKYNQKIIGLKGKKKALDIHHIDGNCGKNSTGYDSSKDLTTMIAICHRCHYNRPEHRVHHKDFRKKQRENMLGNTYRLKKSRHLPII